MGIHRSGNKKGSLRISAMFIRCFPLSAVFLLLAMAGGAGATLESMAHEGDHCLICEGAARPVSKASSNRSFDALQRLNLERQIMPRDLNKNIVSSTRSCPNNPSVSNPQSIADLILPVRKFSVHFSAAFAGVAMFPQRMPNILFLYVLPDCSY
jgi:hypothetical protein